MKCWPGIFSGRKIRKLFNLGGPVPGDYGSDWRQVAKEKKGGAGGVRFERGGRRGFTQYLRWLLDAGGAYWGKRKCIFR